MSTDGGGGGGNDTPGPGQPAPAGPDPAPRGDQRSDSSFTESGDSSRAGGGSQTKDTGAGPNAAAAAAYAGGRHLVSVRAGRDAHVTIESRVVSGFRDVTSTPGPVPREQIEALRAGYVQVDGYDALFDHLRTRRLLILVGPESSGRSTSGLHMLDALANGAVSRLDPSTTIGAIGEHHIESRHGYLGELGLPTGAQIQVAADRLADLLGRQGSYCVLVAAPSPGLRRALGRYRAECPVVAPMLMLAQHVAAGIRADDDASLDERMDQLVGSDRIRAMVGPAAGPSDVVRIAALLLMHGRGEIDLTEVEARSAALLFDERFEGWFSILGGTAHGIRAQQARRLTAMRIAVAVFGGMSRHIAESAAEDLAAQLGAPPAAPTTPGTVPPPAPQLGVRLLDADDALALATAGAIEFERCDVPFGTGTVPGEIVGYRDDRMSAALLRCVWQTRYALRAPIMAWLSGLSHDPRADVRLRAAQAAGLLCSLDFSHTLLELIQPAAGTRPGARTTGSGDVAEEDDTTESESVWQQRREFAAVAMDHAARDVDLRSAVRARLSSWRRDDDPALRWTAAFALGFDVGARDPDSALDELRVLGTPWMADRYRALEDSASNGRKHYARLQQESEVFHAAGSGVAGLFQFGAHRQVLRQLDSWMDDRRQSVRQLAVQAVVFIMGMSVATVGRPEDDSPERRGDLVTELDRRERAGWPVLLALHRGPDELAGPSADLVRRALRSRDRLVVLKVLSRWFRLAAEDGAALATIETLLPLLVVEESDRARLRGLVRQMRNRWEDRLPVAVADRLDNSLAAIRVMTGKKVFV